MAAGGLGARTRRVQGALNRQAWCAGGSLRGEAYPCIYVAGTTAYGARRGSAFQPCGLIRVAMFNCDFLPILQLKCTEE
jgi:hypothetical protein